MLEFFQISLWVHGWSLTITRTTTPPAQNCEHDPAMKPKSIPAGNGHESVWDYPRPPRTEPSARRVLVKHMDLVIAESQNALRVLETNLAPS